MRDWWRRTLARELTRLRNDGRRAVLWSLRITVAAVASYVVGTLLFPGTQPLLAPLTAMLVVQVTPLSLLATGLDRVVAVVCGVSLAVGFATVVPLEWWSLGVLIWVAITLGQVLRLRANLIEVAISGMLVLGVGSLGAESAAWQRLAETLVGAAVGVAATLLFPPKVASGDAGRAIDGLADAVSVLLTRSAGELEDAATTGRDVAGAARGWLADARTITHDIPRVGAALLHAERSRRLNVRAVGTPDLGPGLRQGLEALEHSAIAIRGLFRALVDATRDDPEWLAELHEGGAAGPDDAVPSTGSGHRSTGSTGRDGVAEDVLQGLAQLLREIAAGVDAFGHVVRDEAEPAGSIGARDVAALREALEGLHEARARLGDLALAGSPPELVELHAVALSTVRRLLTEMDLDERVRRQVRLRRPTRPARGRRPRATPPEGLSPEPAPDAETQVLPVVPPEERRPR
ncbi:MAG TPA: FUSC family protein [Nocardioidaceae bacterium]|nr:FUSC family protein [Nocardioidaceae bacterium]